jgi:hypothetical protein
MSSLTLTGQGDVLRGLARVRREIQAQAEAALKLEASDIGEEADISHVPIVTGDLMNSKQIETRVTSEGIEATISYGGPNAPYAAIVHERLAPSRKYLEMPFVAAEKGMDSRLANRIKLD